MSDSERKVSSSRLSVFWTIGLVALAAIVVVVLVLAVYAVKGRSSFESRVEDLREAGMPTTMEELNAFYPAVPDEENAALVYQQAFDAFVPPAPRETSSIPLFGRADLPKPLEWMPPGFFASTKALLAQNGQTLDLLHDAGALSTARYPIGFTAWPNLDFSHQSQLRNAVRLLCLQSVVSAYDGDDDAAVAALADAFAAAGSLDAEPILISHLVQCAVVGMSVDTAEHVLSVSKLSDETLSSLSETSRQALQRSGLRRAFVGERAFGLQGYRQDSGFGSVFRAFFQTSYLNAMDEGIELASDEALGSPHATAQGNEGSGLGRYLRSLTEFTRPNFLLIMESHVRGEVQLALLDTAIAIERYRLEHGDTPEALDGLVPDFVSEVPVDAFTGDTIRYVRKGKGYLLYSLGPDRSDEGGAALLRDNATNKPVGDIAFRVVR